MFVVVEFQILPVYMAPYTQLYVYNTWLIHTIPKLYLAGYLEIVDSTCSQWYATITDITIPKTNKRNAVITPVGRRVTAIAMASNFY